MNTYNGLFASYSSYREHAQAQGGLTPMPKPLDALLPSITLWKTFLFNRDHILEIQESEKSGHMEIGELCD